MLSKKISFKNVKAYNCSCVQKPKVKPYLPGCDNDAAAVAVLPYHWTPKRSGTVLSNYLKKREEDHHKLIKELEDNMSIINEDIEAKIRVLAETLLCHINHSQHDIDCVIKKYSSIQGVLSIETRDEALSSIQKLITERMQDVNNFKVEALQLEKERANRLRKALHDSFNSIVAIGHTSPKEVLNEFDEKIYEINQQLLSNCSAYPELETQLRAQANENQRKARAQINQLCLGVAIRREHSALSCSSSSRIVQKRITSAHSKETTDKLQLRQPSISTKKNNISIKKLTEEYQKAVADLYYDFIGNVNVLYHRIGDGKFIQNKICCNNQAFDEKLEHLSRNRFSLTTINSKIDCGENIPEVSNCIKMIQNSLSSVGKELKYTYTLLHESCHLWDAHIIRVALAEKLTLAAVEDLISKHDSLELASEQAFNISFEQLMTASDAEKLQSFYDVLLVLLKQKSNEYIYHSEAEIGRLNELVNLHIPLSNTVQAEFDLFVSKHPIASYLITGSEDSIQDTRARLSGCDMKLALSREIFQTEVQEIALSNWRNGFLESFQNSLPLLSEKLERQVKSWLSERSLPLKKRLELKLMSLEVRKERIAAARDLRLTEIRRHEACLESHIGAINNLVASLPQEVAQFIKFDNPSLYQISHWLNSIKAGMEVLESPDVDVEVKRLKMLSYSTRLSHHRQQFDESLSSIVELCKKFIANRVQQARIANVQYISHLKLFNEGGNYSALEAMKITSVLVKAGDALESCVTKSTDSLNQRCHELLAEVDRTVHSLQVITEETLKETGKGADKKKPHGAQHGKKK